MFLQKKVHVLKHEALAPAWYVSPLPTTTRLVPVRLESLETIRFMGDLTNSFFQVFGASGEQRSARATG